ncbi:exodeoxyribonuclease V subunit beta [Serratia sp. M24T3]|uniref:exodeoxyribonuclease V subunit beta n=1 Tax=Serratia sp. M24T3 TaxID=932213 RepID=UPI00025B9BC1|nr:exodeoxyribonuclease V subunit beta [Serratia sp. M24T3]EIC84253.1 exonuclease V subunit beta [Serratia sp. M24T3]
MTVIIPHKLNPLTLPLSGERLIEASAGTGKTFTLALLYLRLLLGLGGQAAFARRLTVEEILVVTFTEAATEELRGRIRSNIHELRLACIRKSSNNPMLAALMTEIADLSEAASTLLAAERQMDEAAIYTIHGFCQRMLMHNAFESGILFEQTLIQDEMPLRRQACADFWRRYCYPLPLDIARIISQEWSGPEALLADLSSYLHGEAPQLRFPPEQGETLESRHQRIVARLNDIKQQWLSAAADIEAIITQSGVDKRSYSTRFLPNWLVAVAAWASQSTESYTLPKELERFRQSVLLEKTKKGEPPQHAIFDAIDRLYEESLTIRDLVIARALTEIRQSIAEEKRQHAELGFDDLLSRLDNALQQPSGNLLAQAIRQRYPLAMIDEFQDTDPQQYRIFNCLYGNQTQCGLLLIGDPKQAIYAFRGADIFTYMRARSEVSAHYTMDTNWRSSVSMVRSVNQLFSRLASPFLFSQIPFISVQPASKNAALGFELHGKTQPGMQCWVQPGEGVGVNDYQQFMAAHCAAQIRDWLTAGQQQEAWLIEGEKRRSVQASDITILIRSRREAALIRDALSMLNIPSVYLSNRDSVFDTPEALDVLWLLQAVLTPEHERTLRSAMATGLMGLDALTLDALSQDEIAWDKLVDEFDSYRQRWMQRGVLPMLKNLIMQRHIAEDLLANPGGERRLTDLLHLGELLQEAAAQLDSEHALVRWLAQQIAQPDTQAQSQQLRLESDKHLVKVVTIHKSKGLEYPLVWLPFISNFRQQQRGLYHDRENFAALLDLSEDEQTLQLAEEERLAEDLRLLYVALTRSIYHCSIGIAPLIQGTRKKQGDTDLHLGALGYLVQNGQAGDAAYLAECLQNLADENVAVTAVEPIDSTLWIPPELKKPQLAAAHLTRTLADFWRVTSYSGLQQHGSALAQDLLPKLDVDAAGEQPQDSEPQMTAHSFPRGASPGTFLHSLFEEIDFSQPVDPEWLHEMLEAQGYSAEWLPILQEWVDTVLTTPLDDTGMSLSALEPAQHQSELQFYLPIDGLLKPQDLNALVQHYDALSAQCPPLNFQQVRGMLKGFIDLVYCWQGRYYLLDYKSNWLGEDSSAYTQSAMENAMAQHRYDLQYQLYTLALHRYLGHRLADYNYQQHFGGVVYLFLRGVDSNKPDNGIFRRRPDEEFIHSMDALFKGEQLPRLASLQQENAS